ncbi:hypothetical protein [Flavobacterium poyangense]|uniref:hypothetical protein n=1 Tax=Flavobacterium poyangense TaxID=2204302 RepID=UPI001420D782|nr:hypothetical protein [Flavobacterium sp. JXAS1]
MKYIFLTVLISLALSCENSKKSKNENKDDIMNEKKKERADSKSSLSNGLNLSEVRYFNEKLKLRKYKYQDVFIEDINISDLLNDSYKKDFFNYLSNSDAESEDEFKATFFSIILLERIKQLKDTKAFLLLSESSKDESISYNGIEMLSEYLFKDVLDNFVFYVKESSKYNDITILEYILQDTFPQYLKKESEIKDPMRMCACEDLEKGLILLSKDTLDRKDDLKRFKNDFKNEQIVEIDCSASLENGWKSTTEEYYDLKSIIQKNIESRLDVREKDFLKLKIFPLLIDYTTK